MWKSTIEILKGTDLILTRNWWNPKGQPFSFLGEFFERLQLNHGKFNQIQKKTIEILRGTLLNFRRNWWNPKG